MENRLVFFILMVSQGSPATACMGERDGGMGVEGAPDSYMQSLSPLNGRLEVVCFLSCSISISEVEQAHLIVFWNL